MKIDKSRRIMFFVSLIGIVIVTLIMGTTFAYQTIVVNYKEGSDNDTVVEAGKLNVSYENTNIINLKNMPLLPDYKTSDYTEFTIKTNDTSYDVAYQINLKNLKYSDSLVSENFMYTVTLIDNEDEFVIDEGNFSSLRGEEFNLSFNMNTYRILEKGKSETLRIYLWLKESENTQEIEKSKFEGKIEIVSLFSNEIYFYTETINYDIDEKLYFGDVNFDGVINDLDQELTLEYASNNSIPSELQFILADVSKDNIITAGDALLINGFANGDTVENVGNEYNVVLTNITGDANNDGKVDLNDYLHLERYLRKVNGYLLANFEKKQSDIDKNGMLDIKDLILLKELITI